MSDISTLKEHARTLERQGDVEKALVIYRRLLDDLEGTPAFESELPLLVKVGDLQLKRGESQTAIAMYERAAEHYAGQGSQQAVLSLGAKILRIAPERVSAYLPPCKRLLEEGHVQAARAVLESYAENAGLREIADMLHGLEGRPDDAVSAALGDIIAARLRARADAPAAATEPERPKAPEAAPAYDRFPGAGDDDFEPVIIEHTTPPPSAKDPPPPPKPRPAPPAREPVAPAAPITDASDGPFTQHMISLDEPAPAPAPPPAPVPEAEPIDVVTPMDVVVPDKSAVPPAFAAPTESRPRSPVPAPPSPPPRPPRASVVPTGHEAPAPAPRPTRVRRSRVKLRRVFEHKRGPAFVKWAAAAALTIVVVGGVGLMIAGVIISDAETPEPAAPAPVRRAPARAVPQLPPPAEVLIPQVLPDLRSTVTPPLPPLDVAPSAADSAPPDNMRGVVLVQGLPVASVAMFSIGGRPAYRIMQLLRSGDSLTLTLTPMSSDSVGPDNPRVTTLSGGFVVGTVGVGDYLVTAQARVAADVMTQLLGRLGPPSR